MTHRHAVVNPATDLAYVEYDPRMITPVQLVAPVERVGYCGTVTQGGDESRSKGDPVRLIRPLSSTILLLVGIVLCGFGLYFVFFRPSLLPEDERAIGMPAERVNRVVPGLALWLRKVFWVLGGYIFTTGLLTFYVAATSLRSRRRGSGGVMAFAGITSIGWMAVVNILIGSDYRWPLLGVAGLWAVAIVLYRYDA